MKVEILDFFITMELNLTWQKEIFYKENKTIWKNFKKQNGQILLFSKKR